jgi:hypothetical protein
MKELNCVFVRCNTNEIKNMSTVIYKLNQMLYKNNFTL